MDYKGHRIACLAHPQPQSVLPPVVWIHGLTGSVHFWEAAMYPEISGRRSWYSISLPLHAPSTYDGPLTEHTVDENLLANIIHQALTQVQKREGKEQKKPHLVGYSLGGFAAINYAAKFPDQVATVISVGGFMTGRARGIEGVVQFLAKGTFFRKAMFHLAFRTLQLHPWFFRLATFFYARRWKTLANYPPLNATLSNIWPDVKQHDPEAQRIWFAFLLKMNLLDETTQITCPVLVVAGDRDPIIPYDHQREYAGLLANAELLTLPGVGHVAFGEAPGPFKSAVLSWLERHDGVREQKTYPLVLPK